MARHALGVLKDSVDDLRVDLNNLLGLPLETEIQLSDPLEVNEILPAAPSSPAPSFADCRARALAQES